MQEAHLLHQEVLDHLHILHILLNYQWDSKSLLSLVLVGLPELEGRLARLHHRSLFSRIHTRLRVNALTPDDTAEYLRFRLGRAGCNKELFSSDAIAVHISGLETALFRYRIQLRARGLLRRTNSRTSDGRRAAASSEAARTQGAALRHGQALRQRA